MHYRTQFHGIFKNGAKSLFLTIPLMHRHNVATKWPFLVTRNYSPWNNRNVKSTMNQINKLVPRFRLEKGAISILTEPKEFYSVLKEKILKAEKRIFLASLYIGTNEDELIQALDNALGTKPDLEVHILIDALRGTRESPEKCSASLLAFLEEKFKSRVHCHLYHTPHLHGIKRLLIPHRFNEGWGLQHMKLYGFDDEIILSGANLSHDYFTNRQDRYLVFKDAGLTNYFFRLFQTVSKLSYSLKSSRNKQGYELLWTQYVPEPITSPNEFVHEATRLLAPIIKKQPEEVVQNEETISETDEFSYVYPISQFSQLLRPDTSTEFSILSRILSSLGSDQFNWTLTAGYFNIHPEFRDKLLVTKPSDGAEIITAAPQANGFYNSKGVSSLLPGAYSYLAEKFLKSVHFAGKNETIKLLEWNRPDSNWTYHAKGLWISLPNQSEPFMTVIGSSNYTRRAYSHDLESNVVILTSDIDLQSQLSTELSHLKQFTKPMTLKDYENDDTRQLDWRQKMFCKYWGDKL